MTDYFLETSIKKIKQASENNKLVVFVGAGVSANSGIPTWGQLVEEFAKDLGEFEVSNSSDLYLKIPQYYFNERGEKEYFDKLNEVFHNKKYKTNPIHKEIFKLNPTHIVTTNYDTLLEEAALEEGQFFHTVKHNLDLPYANFNKTIIKMHGDFENRNIVLKEDDYLNYSTNFTLIETYIKSLIATNTVLFIGYSVNDANFNLIFQWVKNILNNHFQPAYLLETSKSPSRIEHSYYKNRGINILYYDEIKDLNHNNIFGEKNEKGNKLFDSLNYFNKYDLTLNKNPLEIIYEKISYLANLEFIMPSQIVKSLNLENVFYDSYGDRKLNILIGENILSEVFSNYALYEKEDKSKLNEIINIFKKANIQGVSNEKREIVYHIKDIDMFFDQKLLDFIEEDSFIKKGNFTNLTNVIEESNYSILFKQAAIYCSLENFSEAYNFYKIISLKAFQDKEYLLYYLSEFNRKYLGEYWKYHFKSIPDKLLNEINEIELEEIYNKLPFRERRSVSILKEIGDFSLIYRVQSKLNKIVNELKETKNNVENGGVVFSNNLNRISHEIINIWLFIKANHLYIEHYTEVKNLYYTYMEGFFASYSTKPKRSEGVFSSEISHPKFEKLHVFEVYLTITKLKNKDLMNLLSNYDLETLNLTEEALSYTEKMLENCIENILENNQKDKSEQYLYNLLSIMSKSNLTKDYANNIAKELLQLIQPKMFINGFKYINNALVSMANKKILKQEVVLQYIEKYVEVALINPKIIEYDKSSFFYNLGKIYTGNSINDELLEKIIIQMKRYEREKHYSNLYYFITHIITPIIEFMGSNYKEKICCFVGNMVNKIKLSKEKISSEEINFYYSVAIFKIVKPCKVINKKLIKDTLHKINQENKSVKSYPDPIVRNLEMITDLYRYNLLERDQLKNYYKEFQGRSTHFDFFFNPVTLKNVDGNLLSLLSNKEIKSLLKDKDRAQLVYKYFEGKFDNLSDRIIFNNYYKRKY